jgi:hypothetical protein
MLPRRSTPVGSPPRAAFGTGLGVCDLGAIVCVGARVKHRELGVADRPIGEVERRRRVYLGDVGIRCSLRGVKLARPIVDLALTSSILAVALPSCELTCSCHIDGRHPWAAVGLPVQPSRQACAHLALSDLRDHDLRRLTWQRVPTW